MPLKQTVLPLLDDLSHVAWATGAVNTVLLSGRRGDNTDVYGIVAALAEAGVTQVERSVVLGGGATAASALAALAMLGDRSPVVLVRDLARAGPLRTAAERLGVQPVIERLPSGGPGKRLPVRERLAAAEIVTAQVVISTLPRGAADFLAADLMRCRGVLLDVVYDPWPTALARAWAGPVVGGAVLLLYQAARQVELMTGRTAPIATMRAALDPGLFSRVLPAPPR